MQNLDVRVSFIQVVHYKKGKKNSKTKKRGGDTVINDVSKIHA